MAQEMGISMNLQDENEICERTLHRLQEHADALGISVEQALEDVIPDTRKRLTAYLGRKGRR